MSTEVSVERRENLKSLRYVKGPLHTASTQLVFRNVHLSLTKSSFARLRNSKLEKQQYRNYLQETDGLRDFIWGQALHQLEQIASKLENLSELTCYTTTETFSKFVYDKTGVNLVVPNGR